MEELRKTLLDFADHLNTYKGFEEVRFDFMVVDYLDTLSNSHKHSVSGKRPMLTEIQIVQAMAAVDEARQKLEALLAACASGAVDKTVSDGYREKYEKCIEVIKRFDAGIIGMYDL